MYSISLWLVLAANSPESRDRPTGHLFGAPIQQTNSSDRCHGARKVRREVLNGNHSASVSFAVSWVVFVSLMALYKKVSPSPSRPFEAFGGFKKGCGFKRD